MTSKEKGFLANYEKATARELWDVYGSFSYNKAMAFEKCRRIQYERSGYSARIPSANSFIFSYAFKYEKDGKEYLYYNTGKSVYDFCIE